MDDRPCVAVCSGKDCRKRGEYRDLRRALAAVAEVEATPCLDLCDSPVVVVAPRTDRARVFVKVRDADQRAALVRLVAGGGNPAKVLRKREVGGGDRRKALAELPKRPPKNRDAA
jgi:hypothetical protein